MIFKTLQKLQSIVNYLRFKVQNKEKKKKLNNKCLQKTTITNERLIKID